MRGEASERLNKIEYSKRTWKSQVFREQEILMEIIVQINSSKGQEKKIWNFVRKLFDEKYRSLNV